MEIVKMKLKDLKAATYNPRKDLKPSDEEFQHIKNSIQEFGYIEPIIVNKRNNVIVGGHQRSKVLDVLGYDEIDCILVDLDEQQEKAANIALNSATGVWDFDKLQDLIKDIKDFDMNEFGFFEDLEQELIDIEDDFNKKDDSDKSNNHILKIDKYEIPLDEDDYEDLINRIKQHLQENGVLFGFYKKLKG